VNAGNSASQAAIDSGNASTVPPVAGFKERCLVCHDDDVIRQQRLTRPQWSAEINKMAGWGARVDDAGRQALLDYLDKLR